MLNFYNYSKVVFKSTFFRLYQSYYVYIIYVGFQAKHRSNKFTNEETKV
jgi:hypothetical protein